MSARERGILFSLAWMGCVLAGQSKAEASEHVIDRPREATFTSSEGTGSQEMPGLVKYRTGKSSAAMTAPGPYPLYTRDQSYQMAQESLNTFQFMETPMHASIGAS